MKKQFKNISSVDFSFCAAGCVAMVEVDGDGVIVNKEARNRAKEGHLIEVKVDVKPKKEVKTDVIN